MALITGFIQSLFQWLPAGIAIPAFAVIAIVFLTVLLKLLGVIFDFLFKFIDMFT